jgi:hypothetical protein
MTKALKGCVTGIGMVIGLLGGGTPARAEPQAVGTLTVMVANQAGIPEPVLAQAEVEAARIFSAIGIHISWVDTREAGPRSYSVRIVTLLPHPSIKGEGPLGVAPGAGQPDARLVFAVYGTIGAFAKQHHTEVARLLGDVIAHELGHLLLPFPSHSARGIMVGNWDTESIHVAQGALQFSGPQGLHIRRFIANTER